MSFEADPNGKYCRECANAHAAVVKAACCAVEGCPYPSTEGSRFCPEHHEEALAGFLPEVVNSDEEPRDERLEQFTRAALTGILASGDARRLRDSMGDKLEAKDVFQTVAVNAVAMAVTTIRELDKVR